MLRFGAFDPRPAPKAVGRSHSEAIVKQVKAHMSSRTLHRTPCEKLSANDRGPVSLKVLSWAIPVTFMYSKANHASARHNDDSSSWERNFQGPGKRAKESEKNSKRHVDDLAARQGAWVLSNWHAMTQTSLRDTASPSCLAVKFIICCLFLYRCA